MNQYFIIINSRTLLTFIISLIVPFFAYKLNISYNIDLTLISIAIIFPVVFTVRGAFRRREKALEHISRFRGSMLTLENLFDENTKMEDDKKKIIAKILIDTSDKLVDHLSKNDYNTSELDKTTGQIYLFVKTNGEFLQTEGKKKF